eukprot:CAMPEP_0116840222 /NCGR_PEP_ID=MMETSP0418-20121206/10215_1 /TAXON_ID=1158023 /ORGANISM="Astrosyne radiata, Strain 13vi08-1A" /LENGTH=39 /DNA_ID= /DNA_START= /DNA_END= /DNA_ORIENTATION=
MAGLESCGSNGYPGTTWPIPLSSFSRFSSIKTCSDESCG